MESLRIIIYSCLVFGFAACQSTPDQVEANLDELDIKNTPAAVEKDSAHPDAELSMKKITPQEAFAWQQMFKMAPNSSDRAQIQKSIQSLENAATVPELLKRARNEVALGRFAKGEATYREILRKERTNLEAMTELAAVYHRTKNSENCLKVLSDIKEYIATLENPDRLVIFRYRYILALAQIQRGDRAAGHEILSDLIGQEKAFVPGYAALASSYLAIGKDQMAKFIVERGLDRGKEDPTLYNILGVIFERQGKTTQARENYNKALALSDGFAPALVNRANLNVKQSEYRLAETDLKKALDYDPLNIEAMISLAAVQRQTGRIDLAKNLLSRVLEVSPESAEARFNLALLMRDNLKNNTEAIRLFNEVQQTEKASSELKSMAKIATDDLKNLY